MANSRTWYGQADYALPDISSITNQNKALAWTMKALLKGDATTASLGPDGQAPGSAFWTVVQCCDGSTVNTSGTDLWTTSYDVTKLVSVASSGAHSWIVLKSPNALGPYYFTIDLIVGASGWNINYAFGKTLPSGGTTSARPTATDEVTYITAQPQDGAGAWSAGGRVHRIIDASGNWWIFTSKNGSGIIYTCHGIQTLTNLRYASDTWPVVFVYDGGFTSGCCKEGSSGSAFLRGGATGAAVRGRRWDGTLTWQGTVPVPDVTATSTGSFLQDIAGAFAADSQYDAVPCSVYTGTTSCKGLKGDFPDLLMVSTAVTPGSRYPSTGTMEKACVGNVLFPLTVSPTL